MARILILTSDMPGMLYPAVELGRRLVSAGHAVVHASAGASARGTVEASGLEFRQLEPSGYEEFLEADAERGLISRLLRLRARRDEALDSLGLASLTATLETTRPELVLIDAERHEEIMAALGVGAKVVLLNSFVSIWRRPGLPPPHTLARPGVGWRGSRAGMGLLWEALRLKKRWRAVSLTVRRTGCDRLSLLRRLARDRGIDFRRETDASQWPIPFTWRRLPVLTMHARELEFPHEPAREALYVGPLVLASRPGPPGTASSDRELAEVYDRCREFGRTLVYAGFGSFFSTDRGFLDRLIEAVSSRDDWELVVSLGGRLEPGDLGRLPERIHAFSWLPQVEVLEHADIAVIHGGATTVEECVLAGVPMLVYCGFETDMAGNAMRVVHHGIGVVGDRRRDGAEAIRARIEGVLGDPDCRRRIDELRAALESYRRERIAVTVVESILERPGEEILS